MPYVLMYHSVEKCDSDPLHITVSPARFAQQLRWLADRRLTGVSMRELLRARAAGNAGGLVGLTFDDGYADFIGEVVPVLLRLRFTATVFVVSGLLGELNVWDAGAPRKALMDAEGMRWAAMQGMEVGSHSAGHRSLTGLSDADLRHEVADSKKALEDVLGLEVSGFCYPYGHVAEREAEAVRRAGYSYACAIWRSPVTGTHALPRTYVGERDGALRLWAKRARHRVRWAR
ncbi:polysaccharide deacetylase family protein [Nonomuraea terrae]|uniref:Polysaccharide deacetylase family protein n=1 Tax=Nonomuraea terrae TaxID=2530383 RepID=A0A4R4ZG22_9ACTN|nr:polysaccharide deacetylase family protein [Nonomuraea terrae]TDD57325.1 polysaccharide deacetylase family protein [Nonomuraea terrae]